jgi:RNA polymerase sigma-70 factor (TIGR02957 family)
VTDPVAVFSRNRSLLFTIAYEITGSAGDAEDVVQNTWLRWSDVDASTVHNPRAFLAQIATRQAMNTVRSAARRREDYVGPWLPEPLITGPDIADDVVLAESVSMAMLVVLQTLSPDERAVFVLREVFGFAHEEIAAAVDKSPAAVRQILHRARGHVQARRPRFDNDPAESAAVLERFAVASATGDLQALMDVLAPDVVLLSDGGGFKQAALRPIFGSDKVGRWLLGVLAKSTPGVSRTEFGMVNGRPATLVYVDDELDTVGTFECADGLVTGLYLIRNPSKLAKVYLGSDLGR